MNKAILSILGQDGPGIVAAVSKFLFEQDCNIENVSQTTLQYIFAGLFVVSMPADLSAESLRQNLTANLAPLDLEVHITSFESMTAPLLPSQSEAYIVTTKGPDRKGLVAVARALDQAAAAVDVDFIGGFTALVEKGMTRGDRALIEAIPNALAETQRVCASVNVASTKAGINMDAVLLMGKIIKQAARLTAKDDGIGCAKLCVFANIPQDIPFMAGAYLGIGEADAVINVGVSGPGVVKNAVEHALASNSQLDLGQISDLIKRTAYKVTRVGELIGREVAARLNIRFGVVDLSLAPTPDVGDSVGEIFQSLGLLSIGVPGTTAALALINDAVKKGGAFASSRVGG